MRAATGTSGTTPTNGTTPCQHNVVHRRPQLNAAPDPTMHSSL
jgi:hypothetical protein